MKIDELKFPKENVIGTALGINLNPLAYLEGDLRSETGTTCESMLNYLIGYGKAINLDGALNRYKEIRLHVSILSIPHNEFFINKIIEPIRYALCDYTIGNYIGTISLCGIVSEMMIIFLFTAWNNIIKKSSSNTDMQQTLSDSGFEKLTQKKRIEKLHELGLIDNELETYFDNIRRIRRKYLHFLTKDVKDMDKDAIMSFKFTSLIIEKGLGLEYGRNKIMIYSHILDYLIKTYPKYEWQKKVSEKVFSTKYRK